MNTLIKYFYTYIIMHVKPVEVHDIITKIDCVYKLLDRYIVDIISTNTILAVSSKVISVIQNRVVKKQDAVKTDLIYQEADHVIGSTLNNRNQGKNIAHNFYLTIKGGRLIPSAGIDESNALDEYILYPNNIFGVAKDLCTYLRHKCAIQDLGIIITDSCLLPMRTGVIGAALAWSGFRPIYSYVNTEDIYHNKLKFSKINLIDSLATSATLVMGEGSEMRPFALISGVEKLKFIDTKVSDEDLQSVQVDKECDLYYALLR